MTALHVKRGGVVFFVSALAVEYPFSTKQRLLLSHDCEATWVWFILKIKCTNISDHTHTHTHTYVIINFSQLTYAGQVDWVCSWLSCGPQYQKVGPYEA